MKFYQRNIACVVFFLFIAYVGAFYAIHFRTIRDLELRARLERS
jgi:hypothetical protein